MKTRSLFFVFILSTVLASAQQNVGIGTASPLPSAILDITSTTKGFLFPRMTYTERTSIPTPATGLQVYQTNSVGTLNPSGVYFFDGSLWKRIARADEIGGSGGSTGWTVSGDNQYSNLIGNVGIGTLSPTSKFHLVGNMLHESGSLTLNNTNATIQLQNAGVNRAFFQLSGNNLRIGTNSNNSGASTIFRMNGNDRMAIDSVGSMGLGTTLPNASAKLDIVSTTRGVLLPRMTGANMFAISSPADGLLVYNTDHNETYQYNGTNWRPILNGNYWSRGISSRDRISNTVDSIGIGTATPISKLQITDGSFVNYTTHNGYIMAGSASGLNLAIGNYEILARDNGGSSTLYLQQEGGVVRIGQSGLVPGDTRLQITDGYEAGLSSNGYFIMGTEAGESITMDNNDIQARNNGSATFLNLNLSGGGVEIGGTSASPDPSTKLYIPLGDDASFSSDGMVQLGLKNATNLVMDENEILVRANGGASTLTLQNDGGDLRVGSGSKLYVGTNGNVGIGTGSPNAKLDVNGSARLGYTTINAGGSGQVLQLDGTAPAVGFTYGNLYSFIQQSVNRLHIASGNSLPLLLDASQVAIGSINGNAPTYKLTVAGKVICEELKVELYGNWPDYVFADDYKLKSLTDLKSFIEINHHLPNIPKATDIAKEGFEVGEMNRKLLEKVEELTLYVIQLQEQIDELKAISNKK